MSAFSMLRSGRRSLTALSAGALVMLVAGCNGDTVGVAGDSTVPADSTLAADTSTAIARRHLDRDANGLYRTRGLLGRRPGGFFRRR